MTLHDRLKTETAALHEAAEHTPVQQALMRGSLPRDAYAEMLGQLLLVHRALESRLREARPRVPLLGALVHDYQFQEPYLLEDLAFLGVEPERVRPMPAASRLIEAIEHDARTRPVALAGYHYVFEGSNNGGRFIAKAVQRAYGFAPGAPGTRYLDPYGEAQRARWEAFKQVLAGASLPPAEADAVVGAAMTCFRLIGELYTEMGSPAAAR